MSDYLIIPAAAIGGSIYIIGDVHGSIEALTAVLAELTPDDILIIAGDLADRGEREALVPTSAEILDLIMAHSSSHDASHPKIYAIQGNHEIDFLALMAAFHQLQEAQDLNSDDLDTPEDRSLVEEVCAAFENYLCNGGGWILNRTQKESAELFLLIRQHQYTTRKQNPRQYEERLRDIRKGISNLIEKNPDPFHFLISGITRYEDYFNALPYVIRIEDEANPAWVVHADNPFNDEALDEKIGENIELTIEEIRDLAYTRPGFFSSARTQESIVTYCGHNIVDNQTVLPFRSSTNAINLDAGAFCRNGFVVVNHSLHTAKMVAAPSISSKHAGELEMFAADINNYLEAMQLRSCNIGFSSRI